MGEWILWGVTPEAAPCHSELQGWFGVNGEGRDGSRGTFSDILSEAWTKETLEKLHIASFRTTPPFSY